MLRTIRRLLIRPGRFRLERELPGGICTHDISAPWQGTQWNKVEHRLFSFITMNWRGKPLRTYETVVNLIGNTTNSGGLVVSATIDRRRYPTGKKITPKQMSELKIEPDTFHGDWNYTIHPRPIAP